MVGRVETVEIVELFSPSPNAFIISSRMLSLPTFSWGPAGLSDEDKLTDEWDADVDVDEMFATADVLEEHCIERFSTADKFDAEGFATADEFDVPSPSLEMFPKHREPVHM